MIKKILALFMTFVLCVAATYMDTEQKYFFASDALIEALQNNVDDEQKRTDAATKYSELMNQQTGMVSIDNLFAVCRAAGFNTYRKEGFDSCKQFINALIELDEDALSGFCPGLDANGKNPNGLKSITNQTRIGDVCSSTNIYAGEVVFKKGYNCTCMAYACNEGYEFKGGSCVTMVADGQGFCLRSDNKIQKDMKLEEAKAFCEDLANKNKCKFKSAVILHKELRILCNATRDEVDNAKQLMFESKEKQKANMKYYEVCDDDKGKSGGKEYCVKGVFNWVNVGQKEAVGLAQEYAKVKNGHNIICAEGYRTSWNDDYIKCATGDKKVFYEFQFDDVVESADYDKVVGILKGLAIIYDANYTNTHGPGGSDSLGGKCDSPANAKVVESAKKYGLRARTITGGGCLFGYEKVTEEGLATIDGLDNRVFYDDIQIKGSQQIEEYLKKYIRGQNITITSFSCDKGYKKMDKAAMMGLKETDDVLHCVLNGKPIDFVFDDMSELSTERSEAGHAGINCKISGGKYAGKRCHGLSKQQCDDMDAKLKQINPGSAGTTWQDEQCILVDVRQQNYIENGIQIGLSVISLVDCATTILGNAQGVMGCALAVVEISGLTTELTTGDAMQNRAQEFIAKSMKCKEHACALTTIRDLAPKVVSIQDALKSASTAKAVDEELARLIDLLEPEDLKSECKGDCNYQDLISALGGDPSDLSGTALKVANKVAFVAQFASLGGSAFRLTGKAIAKLGAKAAQTADAAGDVARAASKVDNVAGAVWDATAKRFRDPKTGRFVSGYTKWTDELAEIGVKESVVNGKKVYTDVKTGAELSETQVLNKIPTSMNDDLATIGVRQIEQADGSIRYLDIRPGGGNKFISEAEVLKRIDDMPSAVKAVDNTADAARAGNKVVNKSDDLAVITRKVSDKYDEMVSGIKSGKNKVMYVPKGSLTESEWKILQESLRKEGLEMMDVPGNAASYGMEQVMIAKRGAQVEGLIFGGAKAADKADDVADVASGASRTVNKTDDVARAVRNAIPSDFSPAAREYISEINEIGKNRDYVVIRGVGSNNTASPLSTIENNYVNQLLKDRDDLIVMNVSQPNGSGGSLGANKIIVKRTSDMFSAEGEKGLSWYRRIKTKQIDNLQGKAITNINGKKVFLEPLNNGGFIGEVSGRPVVVVNYDGHKIPFYASSGSAGKLEVPTGKWEVFFGFGQKAGWFNKADINSIVGHYGSPELKQIAQALDNTIGDQRNVEDVFKTISRKAYNGIGNVASYDGPSVSEDFINRMLDFTPVDNDGMGHGRLLNNIEHVKSYFK